MQIVLIGLPTPDSGRSERERRLGTALESQTRHDSFVTRDLVIRRNDPSDPIDRQVWLSYAVDTVALVQLTPGQERGGIEHPAFGLYRHYDNPVLFWLGGEVQVKEAADDHLADLRLIADQLRAELVPLDGPPEV